MLKKIVLASIAVLFATVSAQDPTKCIEFSTRCKSHPDNVGNAVQQYQCSQRYDVCLKHPNKVWVPMCNEAQIIVKSHHHH